MDTPLPSRVLHDTVIDTLDDAIAEGAGEALADARAVDAGTLLELIDTSGLGGRGGAGFPVARKWRTVIANASGVLRPTVVVNAAEGEPGCFKDRELLRRDPYRVIEGALIAARVVDADSVIIATKATFSTVVDRLRRAIAEVDAAGWTAEVPVVLVTGPREYLFGEETALLEVIDGRPPFPRIAPPYREGVDEMFEYESDVDTGSRSAAHVEMAGPTGETIAPPTLAGNVETFANVPGIVRFGADWFREVGTESSPGTVICTITGDTVRAGVAEIEFGTPLRDVIEHIGGGARPGHEIVAVMSGVANPLLPASALDTPVSHEAMRAAGAGLGAAGFIVFDDSTDLVAVAAGVARFLAVESCGQCRHCKDDGLLISDLVIKLAGSRATQLDLDDLDQRLDTVTDGARCNLATQTQVVVRSVLQHFPELVEAHLTARADASEPYFVAEIADLVDGRATLEESQRTKQPDWTHDPVDSGQWPADRLDDPREHPEVD
jgi:NADH:ubiquinone oxidoreductase subunit F (NADH-binding)